MKKIFGLFVALAVFSAASILTSCRSEPPPVIEPPPEPYIAYVPAPEEPPPPPPKEELPPFEPHAFELRVFELTNRERRIQRLPPLIWHEAAAFAAREHSIDMHNNNFMRQTGSDGSNIRQRLERVCLKNMTIWSASIGGGYLTPEEVVQAWMDSPIYRRNILNRDFTYLGVGFFERPARSNAHFANYWTKKFFALD